MILPDTLFQSLEVMLSELEPYLISPELFWPLPSTSRTQPIDRLTIGNLLLCFDQLHASRATWDNQAETRFRGYEMTWETQVEKWKSSIAKKASLECRSRFNLWRAYLVDLEEGQAAGFDYHREVRNRVMLARLGKYVDSPQAWEDELQAADRLLRALVVPSEFIWESALQAQYPKNKFWFLYQTPRESA